MGVWMDMLDEVCCVMRGLWIWECFSFEGVYYWFEDVQMDLKFV